MNKSAQYAKHCTSSSAVQNLGIGTPAGAGSIPCEPIGLTPPRHSCPLASIRGSKQLPQEHAGAAHQSAANFPANTANGRPFPEGLVPFPRTPHRCESHPSTHQRSSAVQNLLKPGAQQALVPLRATAPPREPPPSGAPQTLHSPPAPSFASSRKPSHRHPHTHTPLRPRPGATSAPVH